MKINYIGKEIEVLAWHEDSTRAGNYVLTLLSPTGRKIYAIERELSQQEINQLIEEVPKDDTGL